MRILIIEDEPELARHISRALNRHGHLVEVRHDGNAGLQAALTAAPDLIVLDLNLPGLNGFALLAQLRQVNTTSRVIILTARGEVEHRIRGLKAGADDYLSKPFSLEELIARIEAMGRRGHTPNTSELLKLADLVMDVQHRRVTRSGRVIILSPREFEVLQVLLQEPGRIFSRSELSERVWQRQHTYDTRTVEIFITRLRKKLDHDFPQALIHTVRAVGYAIRAPE
jgi:DNA-binding response OmpR family regulator